MRCPACDMPTMVTQTRPRYKAGRWKHSPHPTDLDVRRRRVCPACGFRFTTYESVEMSQAEIEQAKEASHERSST